jgi:hypothetical protein
MACSCGRRRFPSRCAIRTWRPLFQSSARRMASTSFSRIRRVSPWRSCRLLRCRGDCGRCDSRPRRWRPYTTPAGCMATCRRDPSWWVPAAIPRSHNWASRGGWEAKSATWRLLASPAPFVTQPPRCSTTRERSPRPPTSTTLARFCGSTFPASSS